MGCPSQPIGQTALPASCRCRVLKLFLPKSAQIMAFWGKYFPDPDPIDTVQAGSTGL